jgi:hypothetical protein
MRRLTTLLTLLLATSVWADEQPSSARARAAAAAMEALEAEDETLAAHGAWQAGRHGFREVEPLLVDWLVRETHVPPAERSWAFVQVLLDALVRLEAKPPIGALLPHLAAHEETVALLIAEGRDVYVDALPALYRRLSGSRQNLPWLMIGHAAARACPRRFMPELLPEIRVVHEVVVVSPLPSGAVHGPRPPPVFRRWTETHPIPDGFPPVAVYRLHTRRAPGRSNSRSGVWTWRVEHVGEELRIERTTQDNADAAAMRLRWLDVMLARAKAGRRPSLSASSKVHVLYTGPTPFREWVLPHRERLLSAWWPRVEGLVQGGFLDAARAAKLAASVDLVIRDRRTCTHPSLFPLPKTRTRNPFRPRDRVDYGSL